MKEAKRIDHLLTITVLTVVAIGCLWVLKPFMTAIALAAILTIATWPFFLRVRRFLRNRNSAAAFVMVVLISCVILTPFIVVGTTIADNINHLSAQAARILHDGPPDLPEWAGDIPLVGSSLVSYWDNITQDTSKLLHELYRLMMQAKNSILSGGKVVLSGLAQLGFAILIAFFFFRSGETLIQQIHAAAHRLALEFGERILAVGASTVRGVVVGILGTALVQGVAMGIGLQIAGITAAPLLGLLTFFLAAIPGIGAACVWLPVGLWLLSENSIGWAIFVFIWGGVFVSSIDNVLRPLIISQSGNLSFITVLLGILGGIMAFGFIGIFLGPVLLAIGYTLVKEWVTFKQETTPALTLSTSEPQPPPSSANQNTD